MLVRAPKTIHGLEGAETRKLSKGEQRKLKQIAKQKEQKAQRAQVHCVQTLPLESGS